MTPEQINAIKERYAATSPERLRSLPNATQMEMTVLRCVEDVPDLLAENAALRATVERVRALMETPVAAFRGEVLIRDLRAALADPKEKGA